jgi:hypothetical protein
LLHGFAVVAVIVDGFPKNGEEWGIHRPVPAVGDGLEGASGVDGDGSCMYDLE